jgi:dihydroxyacid dehydratase/phosphogluconate dehydratase
MFHRRLLRVGQLHLVEDGDTIDINIPDRAINLKVSDDVLKREGML